MSNNSEANAGKMCGLCDVNSSKYCCPRCEVYYCSLSCYKSEKHAECSESFYRECVNEELATYQVNDDAKKKMMEILKKMHDNSGDEIEDIDEEIDSDDCSDIDLHTRIKDLNLDDPDALWSALTEDEKNEFEAMVSAGNLGTIIPQWEPWWSYREEKKLVEEVKNETQSNTLEGCPKIIDIPKFSTLTNIKPSEAIRFNMTNVLASYAFTTRYFNGDLEPIEAATHILDISTNLNLNANFDNPELAVESVAQRCLQSEFIQTDEDSLDVMRNDVYQILQGPTDDNNLHYSKAALSHLIQIFTKSKTKIKKPKNTEDKNKGTFTKKYPEHNNSHLPDLDISKVKKVIKKLEYYLSFLNSCDNKCL